MSTLCAYPSEQPEPFTHPSYAYQDLIKTRQLWKGHEHRLDRMKLDAFKHESGYLRCTVGDKLAVFLNSHTNTVITELDKDKTVKLTYVELGQLLADTALTARALAKPEQKVNL